jgi:hypothetical protein
MNYEHQQMLKAHKESKIHRREWHRDPRRKRSIPPIVLV